MSTRPESSPTFAPRWPTLAAFGVLTLFILVLCLPMLAGHFLVAPESSGAAPGDQIWTGVPFRWFGAAEWRRTGHVPLWNPYMFGGLPFVGAMHGDIFYPTAWLRLAVPIDTAMNLGFAIHLVLAGWFAYLFLRTIEVSWTGSVAGGLAYQLSGIVASLVRPGHDGKLFVSALMPLILLGLVLGIRKGRTEGYALVALTVALGLLAPHVQMMQYTLILAGLFTLWLAFRDERRPAATPQRLAAVVLALAAVVLGVGAAMIQLYPFIKYMPFAARAAGAQGWEYATSWAMPPENIVDWLVPDFTGVLGNYWGSNPGKLHSEYLGAGTLALAAVGLASREHRKLIRYLGGAWVLFVLVALGAHTPFYRLWYAIVPGVKVTRAAGMAFFIPAFIVACFAAFGVECIERGEGRKTLVAALVGAGALLLLGVSGAFGHVAESIALSFNRDELARRNAGAILLAAVKSAAVAAAVAGVGLAFLKGRLRQAGFALLLFALVGGDLFLNVRRFFTWSPPAAQLYADDSLSARMEEAPLPYRVLDYADQEALGGLYPGAFLMGKRIPNVLGHHGNELHAYDQLLGGKNEWTNLLRNGRLWNLLAVRFVILGAPLRLPGFHIVTRMVTVQGEFTLFEADTAPPYARVVPAAVKVPADRIPPTLTDPRLDYDRVVLLDESATGVEPPHLDSLPLPSTSRAATTHWEPGAITVRLDPTPERDAYLLVSENWYPEWRATVDGGPARTLRGQGAFLTVPLPRGAREVRLTFSRAVYGTGKRITLLCLAGIAGWLVAPPLLRRRSG